MKVLVTCGPSYEPADEVRRLTNFSSGELGAILCRSLASHGFEPVCLRGEYATHPAPHDCADVRTFTTNDDLAEQLAALAAGKTYAAVFHAAALCDFKIARIQDAGGRLLRESKVSSRQEKLILTLEPASKLIHRLRGLFPASLLVGWKYELDGTRGGALKKARRQLAECQTDACIVNGKAYGAGFGYCTPDGKLRHLADKHALAGHLASLPAKAPAVKT
jgi:phosphopantothenoylcysteine synthetase/decarboxylase